MSRESEFWGGEVHFPRWLRRRRNRQSADDTPERQRESRGRRYEPFPGKSEPGKTAEDMLGAYKIMLPRDKRRR
jgi:hypothetical protein